MLLAGRLIVGEAQNNSGIAHIASKLFIPSLRNNVISCRFEGGGRVNTPTPRINRPRTSSQSVECAHGRSLPITNIIYPSRMIGQPLVPTRTLEVR